MSRLSITDLSVLDDCSIIKFPLLKEIIKAWSYVSYDLIHILKCCEFATFSLFSLSIVQHSSVCFPAGALALSSHGEMLYHL